MILFLQVKNLSMRSSCSKGKVVCGVDEEAPRAKSFKLSPKPIGDGPMKVCFRLVNQKYERVLCVDYSPQDQEH